MLETVVRMIQLMEYGQFKIKKKFLVIKMMNYFNYLIHFLQERLMQLFKDIDIPPVIIFIKVKNILFRYSYYWNCKWRVLHKFY